jgi:hypothetical protein
MNQDFERVFERLLGKPCWDVKPGQGSFLTLEFGKPHLEVREPIAVGKGVSERVGKHLARRRVYVHGAWHLWIYSCDWEVNCKGKRVGDSSTKLSARRAADFVNGRKLIRFSILQRKVQSTFVFEHGVTLKTFPYDKRGEQWLIFDPSCKVLVLRADGRYKYVRSDRPTNNEAWKPI